MKIKEGFVLRKIAGANIVVPIGAVCVDFNGMITMNDSATFLWERLAEGADEDRLVNALLGEYEVDEKTARECVKTYIAKLEEAGCIE